MLDFRDAVFDTVFELMSHDKDVVILYNDMGAMGIDKLRKAFPDRTINAGIAEQNLMSVAAGLALTGKRVFAYGIIAHVTNRCYEQIKVDICTMQLPVTILGIGSGLSYGMDGPTHHAIQDIALMRALPGIAIYNPGDAVSASACVELAYQGGTPAYIRLDKNQHDALYSPEYNFSKGMASWMPDGRVLLISTGIMTHFALQTAQKINATGGQKDVPLVSVVDLFQLKPVPSEALIEAVAKADMVITMEEHIFYGGIGSIVTELVHTHGLTPKLKCLHLQEGVYLGSTGRKWAYEQNGLTFDALNALIQTVI